MAEDKIKHIEELYKAQQEHITIMKKQYDNQMKTLMDDMDRVQNESSKLNF